MKASRLNSFLANFLRKKWTPEKVQKYIGSYKSSYFCYSSNLAFREMAASGGTSTALLDYLIKTRVIDGALVCRSVVNEEGKLRPEFFIAQSTSDLLSAQGSKYCAVYFSSQALPLIKKFNKKVAVVALPCDTRILRNAIQNDPILQKNVVLIISMFCGHNSEPVLTDHIIDKIRPDGKQLTDFRYRMGHWRGELRATFEGDTVISKPFSYFSIYQNLYFFSQRKCHHCYDHTGYYSDLSLGDIWSLRMKDNPIKHNAMIVRTKVAEDIIKEAFEKGIITGNKEPIEEICDGQARTLPTHYNISARGKLGRIVNEKIKDPVNEKVNLNNLIVAALNLINARISRTGWGKKLIFSIPSPFLKIYLYIIKFFESF